MGNCFGKQKKYKDVPNTEQNLGSQNLTHEQPFALNRTGPQQPPSAHELSTQTTDKGYENREMEQMKRDIIRESGEAGIALEQRDRKLGSCNTSSRTQSNQNNALNNLLENPSSLHTRTRHESTLTSSEKLISTEVTVSKRETTVNLEFNNALPTPTGDGDPQQISQIQLGTRIPSHLPSQVLSSDHYENSNTSCEQRPIVSGNQIPNSQPTSQKDIENLEKQKTSNSIDNQLQANNRKPLIVGQPLLNSSQPECNMSQMEEISFHDNLLPTATPITNPQPLLSSFSSNDNTKLKFSDIEEPQFWNNELYGDGPVESQRYKLVSISPPIDMITMMCVGIFKGQRYVIVFNKPPTIKMQQVILDMNVEPGDNVITIPSDDTLKSPNGFSFLVCENPLQAGLDITIVSVTYKWQYYPRKLVRELESMDLSTMSDIKPTSLSNTEKNVYTQATARFDFNHTMFTDWVRKHKISRMVKGEGIVDYVRRLLLVLRRELRYDENSADRETVTKAIENIQCNKLSIAMIFVSCCRYAGVPCRLINGQAFNIEAKKAFEEVRAEVHHESITNNWLTVDPYKFFVHDDLMSVFDMATPFLVQHYDLDLKCSFVSVTEEYSTKFVPVSHSLQIPKSPSLTNQFNFEKLPEEHETKYEDYVRFVIYAIQMKQFDKIFSILSPSMKNVFNGSVEKLSDWLHPDFQVTICGELKSSMLENEKAYVSVPVSMKRQETATLSICLDEKLSAVNNFYFTKHEVPEDEAEERAKQWLNRFSAQLFSGVPASAHALFSSSLKKRITIDQFAEMIHELPNDPQLIETDTHVFNQQATSSISFLGKTKKYCMTVLFDHDGLADDVTCLEEDTDDQQVKAQIIVSKFLNCLRNQDYEGALECCEKSEELDIEYLKEQFNQYIVDDKWVQQNGLMLSVNAENIDLKVAHVNQFELLYEFTVSEDQILGISVLPIDRFNRESAMDESQENFFKLSHVNIVSLKSVWVYQIDTNHTKINYTWVVL